jgi:hypothetical protein
VTCEFVIDMGFPLWTSAPASAGGLDFSPMQIGQVDHYAFVRGAC